MGVEYRGIGGIGIEFTKEMEQKVANSGVFDKDDWSENTIDCFFDFDIEPAYAGNAYTGEKRIYLLVGGKNLTEINNNKVKFIGDLSSCGIKISEEDLMVIEDYQVF